MAQAATEEILSLDIDNSRAKKSVTEMIGEFLRLDTAAKKTAAAVNGYADTSDKAGAVNDNTVKRLREVDKEYDRLMKRIPGTAAAVERFGQVQAKATADLNAGRISLDAYNRIMDNTRRKYMETGAAAASGLGQAAAATDRLRGSMEGLMTPMNLVMGGFAGFSVVAFINGVKDATLSMERLQSTLAVGVGADKAAGEFAFVRAEAQRLGLDLKDTATEFARFAAATKGTALEGKMTRDVFVGISEAAAALKLSSEQTGGALTALSQMVSKGKVQAEELRGQLGERLPGAFQMAANAMGVTTAELDKMLQTGSVTAEMLLPKLAAEMHRTFGPQAQESAHGLQATLNRLNTAWFELQNAVAAGGLSAGLTDAAKTMTSAASGANSLAGELGQGLGDGIRASASAAAFLVEHLTEVKAAVGGLVAYRVAAWALESAAAIRVATVATNGLTAALMRNPLTIAAVGIAAATAAVIEYRESVAAAEAEQIRLNAATEDAHRIQGLSLETVNSMTEAGRAATLAKAKEAEATLALADAEAQRMEILARARLSETEASNARYLAQGPGRFLGPAEQTRLEYERRAVEQAAEAAAKARENLNAAREGLVNVETAARSSTGGVDAASSSLSSLASAADVAHAALVKLKQIQAEAGAKFYTNEKELQAEIAALKGGEEAMRKYNEEKVRSKAWADAYNQSIKSGMESLDATSEATRIAALAVEKYNLQLQRNAGLKESKADSRADERDQKAYERTADALEREVEARRRVAMATIAGSEALREANLQSKIATELSRARADAGTAEAAAIERQIRELDKWDRVADAAALVNQTLDAGRTPLEQYQRQVNDITEALQLLQANGVQMAAEDIAALNRALADANPALQEIKKVSEDISEDIAENLYDRLMDQNKATSVTDFFKSIFKRIAVEALKTKIIMPMVTEFVGGASSLFGISNPATTPAIGRLEIMPTRKATS